MKKIKLFPILAILLFLVNACNSDYTLEEIKLNNESKILSLVINNSENIKGFIDEKSKSILLEVPNQLELSTLKINLTVSENAKSEPSSGSVVDLSNPSKYKITAENGTSSEYRVVTYTVNQLVNPNGDNGGYGWSFSGNTGVELTSDFGNIFFVKAYDGNYSPNINQTITFPRDYSKKHILFIGNLTTEKVVANSITRHPYLWAQQMGNFLQNDWVYMQGMLHTQDKNVWQIVYGTHQLLANVKGTYFQIAQANQNGDPYDGTKSKYRDLEVRLFESSADAKIYIAKLYKQ